MSNVEVLTRRIDCRPWRGSTPDELGYGDGNHLPSLTYRHEADNGQQTNVFVVDGRTDENDPTILGVTPYNYRIDPMLEVQSKIKAHQASARVIMTEMPGVTIDLEDPWNTKGDRLSVLQLSSHVAGYFDRVALGQLEAVDAAIGLSAGETIRLQAESLGTVAIAAMMKVIGEGRFSKEIQISNVDIIESVNTFGDSKFLRPLRVLKNLENIEAPLHEFYFDENRLIGHTAVTAFERTSNEHMALWEYLTKKQRWAVMSPAIGLHRSLHGALAAGLKSNSDLRDSEITFYRGADSSVSRECDVVAAAEAISELSGHARVVNLVAGTGDDTSIGHHFGTSLGRLASFAQQLRR